MPEPQKTAALLRKRSSLRPQIAFVLGSGFGTVLDDLRERKEIPFKALPGLPPPTVKGHTGKLVLGTLRGTPLLILRGRSHYYEGFSMEDVAFPIRMLAEFGISDLIITNAAGALKKRFRPGNFMVLSDHINFMGTNPLRGTSRNRFVDLSKVYDPNLRSLLHRAAKEVGQPVQSGTYLAVSGPSYETPAEIRAFARLGGDAIGMSTVPEAIVARQCGMRVGAISCITNMAAGLAPNEISHAEVLATAELIRDKANRWLTAFIRLYQSSRQAKALRVSRTTLASSPPSSKK